MKFSSAIGVLAAVASIVEAAPAVSSLESRQLELVQSVSLNFTRPKHASKIRSLTIAFRINCVESSTDPNSSRRDKSSKTLHTRGQVATDSLVLLDITRLSITFTIHLLLLDITMSTINHSPSALQSMKLRS